MRGRGGRHRRGAEGRRDGCAKHRQRQCWFPTGGGNRGLNPLPLGRCDRRYPYRDDRTRQSRRQEGRMPANRRRHLGSRGRGGVERCPPRHLCSAPGYGSGARKRERTCASGGSFPVLPTRCGAWRPGGGTGVAAPDRSESASAGLVLETGCLGDIRGRLAAAAAPSGGAGEGGCTSGDGSAWHGPGDSGNAGGDSGGGGVVH
mmetsp:Transcript_11315/g.22364  ORF Transcript_11315/g.22364 Transcript_11315/m.22364 type:complete len:203 (+) Transcript_11315:1128-1736(+)